MSVRRTKPADCYAGSENQFQRTAIALVRSIASTQGVRIEAVMHVPNGGQRNAIVAAKLKGMGTIPGYPDIMVFATEDIKALSRREGWGDRKCGLALELKVWPNKPSESQLIVHQVLRDAGWSVAVCYGLEEVRGAVCKHFDIQ